jgi:serine protease Do
MSFLWLRKRALGYLNVAETRAVRTRRPVLIFSAMLACLLGSPALGQVQTESQVRLLQEMLIWTADYEGVIDGRAGPETAKAIKAFQARLGNPVTGQLTQAEEKTLKDRALRKKNAAGFQQIVDNEAGVSVGIPLHFVSDPKKTKWGNRWYGRQAGISIDTLRFGADVSLRQLYDRLTSINNRTITYQRFVDNDWFVVAALEGDSAVYVRANLVSSNTQPSEIRGFSIWMSKDRPANYQALPPAMLSSFSTTPATQIVRASPTTTGAGQTVKDPPPLQRNLPPSVGDCYRGLGGPECPIVLTTFR